jgi:hypothetical protein
MIVLKLAKNTAMLCKLFDKIAAYGFRNIRRSEFPGENKSTNSSISANNKILSPYSQEEQLRPEGYLFP